MSDYKLAYEATWCTHITLCHLLNALASRPTLGSAGVETTAIAAGAEHTLALANPGGQVFSW